VQALRWTPSALPSVQEETLENHPANVALYFRYNSGRMHQTFRVPPATEAGIADHVWSIDAIVGLMGGAR
jgi:hypothetical protein